MQKTIKCKLDIFVCAKLYGIIKIFMGDLISMKFQFSNQSIKTADDIIKAVKKKDKESRVNLKNKNTLVPGILPDKCSEPAMDFFNNSVGDYGEMGGEAVAMGESILTEAINIPSNLTRLAELLMDGTVSSTAREISNKKVFRNANGAFAGSIFKGEGGYVFSEMAVCYCIAVEGLSVDQIKELPDDILTEKYFATSSVLPYLAFFLVFRDTINEYKNVFDKYFWTNDLKSQTRTASIVVHSNYGVTDENTVIANKIGNYMQNKLQSRYMANKSTVRVEHDVGFTSYYRFTIRVEY